SFVAVFKMQSPRDENTKKKTVWCSSCLQAVVVDRRDSVRGSVVVGGSAGVSRAQKQVSAIRKLDHVAIGNVRTVLGTITSDDDFHTNGKGILPHAPSG